MVLMNGMRLYSHFLLGFNYFIVYNAKRFMKISKKCREGPKPDRITKMASVAYVRLDILLNDFRLCKMGES